MIRLIVIALFAALLAACQQSNDYTPSTHTTATVHVYWQRNVAAADAKCKALGLHGDAQACARSDPGNPAVCEIYAVEPHGFRDHDRLATLGHEFWHCLGAKHPELWRPPK